MTHAGPPAHCESGAEFILVRDAGEARSGTLPVDGRLIPLGLLLGLFRDLAFPKTPFDTLPFSFAISGERKNSSFFAGKMVGARGFEPPTPCPPGRCATRLRYAPIPFLRADSLAGAEHSGGPFRQQARIYCTNFTGFLAFFRSPSLGLRAFGPQIDPLDRFPPLRGSCLTSSVPEPLAAALSGRSARPAALPAARALR